MKNRIRSRVAPTLLAAFFAVTACDRTPAPEPTARTGIVAEVVAYEPAAPVERSSFSEALDGGGAHVSFFYVPSGGFAYLDGEGHLTGVTVELLRDFAQHVADAHGIDLEVEWIEEERWADFYGYVRASTGGAFGIGNVTITDARREELDFSPPYMRNVAVLVTHEEVPELRSLDEVGEAFAGLTALPYPGTLHETRLEALGERYLPDMATRPVASNDELVTLLVGGGHFGYIDVYNYWGARERGLPLRRHSVGDDDSEAFGVILPRGSDWTPVIEDFFFHAEGGYVDSSRFRRLLEEHLGQDLAAMLAQG